MPWNRGWSTSSWGSSSWDKNNSSGWNNRDWQQATNHPPATSPPSQSSVPSGIVSIQSPPPSQFRSFWVAQLPPNGRGYGITSMCFNMPADGIVDDLKQVICEELSHPRFYLTKRAFRLKLNGNHQQYYIKLSTIDNTTPLTFEWAEPFTASCVCGPLLPRGHRIFATM